MRRLAERENYGKSRGKTYCRVLCQAPVKHMLGCGSALPVPVAMRPDPRPHCAIVRSMRMRLSPPCADTSERRVEALTRLKTQNGYVSRGAEPRSWDSLAPFVSAQKRGAAISLRGETDVCFWQKREASVRRRIWNRFDRVLPKSRVFAQARLSWAHDTPLHAPSPLGAAGVVLFAARCSGAVLVRRDAARR